MFLPWSTQYQYLLNDKCNCVFWFYILIFIYFIKFCYFWQLKFLRLFYPWCNKLSVKFEFALYLTFKKTRELYIIWNFELKQESFPVSTHYKPFTNIVTIICNQQYQRAKQNKIIVTIICNLTSHTLHLVQHYRAVN